MNNTIKRLFSLLLLIFAISLFTACDIDSIQDETLNLYPADLLRVVDGDTLLVSIDDEERYVRLIGIDTPESVNPDESKNTEDGKLASGFVKHLLKDTETVYLEMDIQETDSYDRILAYVYLDMERKEMLQNIILYEGYAVTMTVQPNSKYSLDFAKAERTARKGEKGLWGQM